MWNEKFSREGYLYGKKPNAFLASQLQKLDGGSSILFLGEGEGRNACYAALLGFQVTALDASDVGLDKAEELSCEMGVCITTIHADLEQWKSDTQYDFVMCSFLHLAEPLRTKAFREAVRTLKPGGKFIGEFFSTKQLPLTSGGPKDVDLLYNTVDLERTFDIAGAEIEFLEEHLDSLDEGVGHQGEAVLVRVIVRKTR